jgi:hypothetical protein
MKHAYTAKNHRNLLLDEYNDEEEDKEKADESTPPSTKC